MFLKQSWEIAYLVMYKDKDLTSITRTHILRSQVWEFMFFWS